MRIHIAALCVAVVAGLAMPASAHRRETRKHTPKFPGITHSGTCKELAPGVYDCGNKKNQNRVHNKKTGRWKIVYRPTADVSITAQSKAAREETKKNR